MSNETQQTPLETEITPAAPPAYFLSLTVENFRCFDLPQTLDLSSENNRPFPWTIILGENGVGKTTLLQCLAASQPFPEELPHEHNKYRERVFASSEPRLRALGFAKSTRAISKGGIATARIICTVGCGSRLRDYASDQIVTRLLSLGAPQFLSRDSIPANIINLAGLICYGYGASRSMGRSILSEQRSDDTTASLFSDDVDLINAEEWLLQADYSASKVQGESIAAQRRDQVKQVLIDLLPDVTDLRIDIPKGSLGSATVEFETHYGWVPLNSLSLGYRTLITWMVDLASRLFDRYPDSPNPLAEPAVVLVDEIDLHLHPRWQRTLMQFLSDKFPNAQFIATAHSPLVVQAAKDANIVLLRREGDHVVIDNNVETIKNWRVDQILTSDLFGLESARPPQLDESLAERSKILSKARLTPADERRLKELERQIGQLPTGETPEDMQAMDIIRRAAELLKTE